MAKSKMLRGVLALTVIVLWLHPTLSRASPFGDAQVYLTKYSYLKQDRVDSAMKTSKLLDKSTLSLALKQFQEFAGLPETGEPDEETLRMMHHPRCGVTDVSRDSGYMRRWRRYTHLGSKWQKKSITYRILNYSPQLSQADTDYWIREAFQVWMAVIPLRFQQIYWGKADIEILFRGYEHGDPYPFDGQGSTLAHAFEPGVGLGGDAHFDDSEIWVLRNPNARGNDLFSVAVHEFGHSLGLGHSKQEGAIMRPFYSYVHDSNNALSYDDIVAIQTIYGPNTDPKPYPTKAPRGKTTTVAPTTTVPECCETVMQFDAIVSTASGKTYAFAGWQHLYIWNDIDLDPAAPKLTSSVFKRLHWGADMAFSVKWGNRELIYIIFAWFAWIYDARDLQLVSKQVPMNHIFPDLPHKLDAAFHWGHDRSLYIFRGFDYWKMEQIEHDVFKAVPGFPRPVTDWNLPIGSLSAVLYWPVNGRTYFFSGQHYYKYDDYARKVVPSYPRSIKTWWLHCPDIQKGFNMGSNFNAIEGSNSKASLATTHSALFMFTIAAAMTNLSLYL